MPSDSEISSPDDLLDDDTEPQPLEVKIINQPAKLKQWNDSYDDFEYDEHTITDEEIKEANTDGNT